MADSSIRFAANVAAIADAPLDATVDAIKLCAIPAGVMLCTSLLALNSRVPAVIVGALQHLAAGIVLSAVAVELVPEILAAPDDFATTAGMTIGFMCGIGLFLMLSKYCGHSDDDDDDSTHDPDHLMHAAATPLHESNLDYSVFSPNMAQRGRSNSAPSAAFDQKANVKLTPNSKVQLMRDMSEQRLQNSSPPFPVVLTVAVTTDAMVDGLLIGISSASGAQAGLVITGALSIEMGFLGLTFASTLRAQPFFARLLAILLPPLVLLAGGATGGVLSSLLAAQPVLHTGLIAFGVAALLYLVTEELLLEAHAGTEDHIWWVDAMFFVGFYLSFLLEKFTRAL